MGFHRQAHRRALLVALALAATLAACDTVERGIAGESCRARNDCRPGLACIRNTCLPAGTGLSVTGRECFRIECADDAGCCAAFVPDPSCDFYAEACAADPSDCVTFRLLCECNRRCDTEVCVDLGPSCATDSECPMFSRPFCVSSRCAECREHADCGTGGARCVESRCATGCVTDEECPLLHTCEAGTCSPTGCTSDRECVFVLEDSRARCVDTDCRVSCSDDAECDGASFEVCYDGQCVFAGCESDAECRVYLGLAGGAGDVRAVCR